MALRRELVLALGALVALNVMLAFGSIGLFVRMGPAIEQILEENVDSLVAAEEILAELAATGGNDASPQARARIAEALRRAEENVTEAGEITVLETVRANVDAALNGDRPATVVVVRALEALMKINREAMHAVDEEAKRLGRAGAWAATFIGIFSFLLSLVAIARLRTRVIEPLAELHDVLEAVHEGDPYRRCRPCDAPQELQQVRNVVNTLLDERLIDRSEDLTATDGSTRAPVLPVRL